MNFKCYSNLNEFDQSHKLSIDGIWNDGIVTVLDCGDAADDYKWNSIFFFI